MNASEAAQVLTAAALVDKRTVGEADARMWAEILPETIGPRVAIEAVKAFYRENTRMIMPADVATYASKAHDRLRRGLTFNYDAYRELPTTGDRILYSREFYEAVAGGSSSDEAHGRAMAYIGRAPDTEKRAIEPPPKPASYYTEYN